jgi:hypothetical protein
MLPPRYPRRAAIRLAAMGAVIAALAVAACLRADSASADVLAGRAPAAVRASTHPPSSTTASRRSPGSSPSALALAPSPSPPRRSTRYSGCSGSRCWPRLYHHALDLHRELHDRYREATTLHHLGHTYAAMGNPRAARDARHQSRTILDKRTIPTPAPPIQTWDSRRALRPGRATSHKERCRQRTPPLWGRGTGLARS